MAKLSDDEVIEKMIKKKGLVAPRIKPSNIDDKIKKVKYHVFSGTCTTVCCIILDNGYTVIGESACASPENFDEEIGKVRAFQKAKSKIWELAGYHFLEDKYNKSLGE